MYVCCCNRVLFGYNVFKEVGLLIVGGDKYYIVALWYNEKLE